MVDVAVAVDHRGHRPGAAVVPIELDRGAGYFRGDERIDDDDAAAALDDRHVGDVEAAHLVDAVSNLEQAVVHVEPCLAPQARVDGIGSLLVRQEGVVLEAVDHTALGVADLDLGQRADEASCRIRKIRPIAERQHCEEGAVVGAGDGRSALARAGFAGHGW